MPNSGITGGIPSKLGNRYEAKWLVRCLFDVISGKAQWLKFEGIQTEYAGFEFAIQYGDIIQWHQTKINASQGNWTINRMDDEGILKAFKNRLTEDENAACYFVSEDNAKDFRTLSEKALLANDLAEYFSALSKAQKDKFDELQNGWNCSQNDAFLWLKRCFVRIIPDAEIDSSNESYGDCYFYKGGKASFPALRDILENHFNKTITPEFARDAIRSQGILRLKDGSLEPTLRQKLAEETRGYLDTYSPFGAGGATIPRKESAALTEELRKPDGAQLILLTGVAGSGKSGVVRRVIQDLQDHGILHLAFRVDHYLSCSTREELGRNLIGRDESPVSTLKGIAPDSTAVLIIDQVDAVSEVSGRNGQIKEVLFRLIADAQYLGNIRIIVVCRSFDLDSDSRFKRLEQEDKAIRIEVALLDWNSEVEPLLAEKNIIINGLSEHQRNLLCLPVNLSVFLEIDDSEFTFQSRSALLGKLIEKKQRELANRESPPSWALIQPLQAVCDWMSDRQKLAAPSSILDNYPSATDILRSEGLIVSSRGQLNFFHESFFDYIYARGFVNNSKSLVKLLTSTEQHLFRRTQTRQILDALRQNDWDRYLGELSSTLSSPDIRFHLKVAISQWLSSIKEPTQQEFEVVARFDDLEPRFSLLFRYALLSTGAWFTLLYDAQWIKQQLESPHEPRRDSIFLWLSNIAGQYLDEIAALLRVWWENKPERAERLLAWFEFIRRSKPDKPLLSLCEDIIKSRPANLFRNRNRDHMSRLLDTWTEKNPDLTGHLLHTLFDAWFELHPGRNPFERDELKDIDTHSLAELAKKSPLAFLEGTTDALAQSIDMALAEGLNGYNFKSRTYSGPRFGFDEFLGIYRSSLQSVARTAPDTAIQHLTKLDANKHECFMHLHLETIRVNPQALGYLLIPLISNPIIFDAGWNGADWWSFASAASEVLPFLDLETRKQIENIILAYNPEIDLARKVLRQIKHEGETEPFYTRKGCIYDLRRSGEEQWYILETVRENKLFPQAVARLHELRRKFSGENIPEPKHIEAHTVGSPIKRPQCERMKDQDWLSAIERYSTEYEKKRGRSFVDGGAPALLGELQEATKKEPERFSALSLRIPDSAYHGYIESILWGLSEVDEVQDICLTRVIRRAHAYPNKPFGDWIARVIHKHPHIAHEKDILECLLWYAEHGEANEEEDIDTKNVEHETLTIESLLQRGNRLHVRGINGARGQAWEAIAAVLWWIPEAVEQVWPTLENALIHEKLISVRCSMIQALTPLFNSDKSRFSNAIRQLITLPNNSNQASRLSPLITHSGIHLFPYIFYWLPDLAEELVNELLDSGDETIALIGAWLIFGESFRNDAYIERADNLAKQSIQHRRLLAGVSADVITWADNRNRCKDLLVSFFFDEDEQVRKQTADTFRRIPANEISAYLDITEKFINSPAFFDEGHFVLHMLKNATCDILDLVLNAANRLTDKITKKGPMHKLGGELHDLQDLLKREYASSEQKSNARKQILDLIDLMLAQELYGVDNIIRAHER